MTEETEQSVTLTPREIEEELNTPLPRGAGADAPQSVLQDAHVPLEYTEQTFNQLVAANTAMTGEISMLNQLIAENEKTAENLRGWLGERGEKIDVLTAALKERDATIKDLKAGKEEALDDASFAGRQRDALQRRLDRSLGYLDRVLDDEDGIRAPDHRTVPPPKPLVGPALGAIPDPIRPSRSARDEFATIRSWSPGERIETDEGRRRRY